MPDWKNKGETIEHKGATLHWCKNHVHIEGLWDGLCMSHKPEDHEIWKEGKNQRYGKKSRFKTNESTLHPKLSLSYKIKTALATKCKIESNDIEDMLNNRSLD